jgi:hypothetical protein
MWKGCEGFFDDEKEWPGPWEHAVSPQLLMLAISPEATHVSLPAGTLYYNSMDGSIYMVGSDMKVMRIEKGEV